MSIKLNSDMKCSLVLENGTIKIFEDSQYMENYFQVNNDEDVRLINIQPDPNARGIYIKICHWVD